MTQIMVVDDNEDVAETVSIALNEAGYTATAVHSLDDARRLLSGGNYAGAIIDVWMNEDNGLELASELAQHTPPIPFIIMSGGGPGKTLEQVTARADSIGAVAVLFKPFEDDELLTAVSTMLNA
ncbi:response regulator [Parvularcula marina]|uniref:response regulator n=1 Tax=Parvularcula marina TaxID=2292771 RepID=UPI003516C94E